MERRTEAGRTRSMGKGGKERQSVARLGRKREKGRGDVSAGRCRGKRARERSSYGVRYLGTSRRAVGLSVARPAHNSQLTRRAHKHSAPSRLRRRIKTHPGHPPPARPPPDHPASAKYEEGRGGLPAESEKISTTVTSLATVRARRSK